jgi:hypothetical protein
MKTGKVDRMGRKETRKLHLCAYCHRRIGDNCEVFGVKAKVKAAFSLANQQGHILDLDLLDGRTLYAIVPTRDSEAKQDGADMLFMVCSEKCGRDLKRDLEADKSLIEEVLLS